MIRTVVMTSMVAALMASPLAAQEMSQQDMQFAEKAAEGGLLEVQLGELATQQAKDQAVVDFGQMMVDDHSIANQQLMDIAQQKGIQLPTDLSQEGQQHLNELQQQSGSEFDQQYMDLMVTQHEKDIDLFQQQVETGQDPELTAFAEQTLPVLQQHLDRAEEVHSQVSSAGIDPQQHQPAGQQQASLNAGQ